MKQTENSIQKPTRNHLLSRRDWICMTVLTLFFAAMALFRLGNLYAPQTTYAISDHGTDIILDFGEYTGISSVSMYLNAQANLHFTLSAFNEVTREWELFNDSAEASSVFTWNKLDVNYRLRYLGIVALEEDTVLNELVAVTTDGKVICPVNAAEYTALFDEQEMYPEVCTYMDGTMFDEVYHGRTAYEFLHGLPTYENTHPHLGKILIAAGIRIFGMTPFGMRVMSVLFGTLMVPLIYLFAKRLFQSTFAAAATALLLVFDCMHFTLSRIATIDIFAAFFILLMYYFMYRYLTEDGIYRSESRSLFAGRASSPGDSFQPPAEKFPPLRVAAPLALCGVSMGLGIAVKWTGIYAGAGLAVLFLVHTATHFPGRQTLRLFFFCCLFFVVIPLAFYVLCFLPVVGDYSGLLDKAIRGTQHMFSYHANLDATHFYSSPFYEWPVIWMPLLDACDSIGAAKVSAVNCMGNPAIWWAGIPCLLYVLFCAAAKKDRQAGFLCVAYLAQYIPWMLVPRCTFIYHYFPAAVMMLLCMGYTIHAASRGRRAGRAAVCAYLALAVSCFALFYPVISGVPFFREWGMHLRWLKDWVLVL